MKITSLEKTSISELVDGFNDAFSQYVVPVHLTGENLRKMLKIRDVELQHSFGMFDRSGNICAFVLNAVRSIDGKPNAYNAATGVRIAHQRKGMAEALLQASAQHLATIGIEKYRLEVITSNSPAVLLYQKLDFHIRRQVNCFSVELSGIPTSLPGQIESREISLDSLQSLSNLLHHKPTWQNASPSVLHNADDCELLVQYQTNKPIAFLIVDRTNGGIMQLGIQTDICPEAFQPLIQAVAYVSGKTKLSYVNLDSKDTVTHAFLEKLNWKTTVSQHEMIRKLTPV